MRVLTSKPVLVAGALAARKKIMQTRARRRRRKSLALGSGLALITLAGAAAYRFWMSKRPIETSEDLSPDYEFRSSSINLDAPEPAPNI